MKKILMYTNDKIYTTKRMTGGIKRFVCLYEGLVRHGYDVELYCGEDKVCLEKYNLNAKSINLDTNRSKVFPSFKIMINNFKLLLSLKKNNYDKVIVFDVPTAISLSLMNFSNIALFLRQDLIEYRKVLLNQKKKSKIYQYFYLRFMKFCEYICLKKSKQIIVQCNYDLNNLFDRHIFLKKDIKNKSYIQINNINPSWIVKQSKIEVKEVRKNLKFKIGFIGDFSNTRKGHNLLLASVKQIIDEGYQIEVYIVGDGKTLDFYRNEFKKYNQLHFLGRLKNPIEVLKQIDLLIVPSLADSCPNTVLEALYNDILVIGSNRGGIPEILENKKVLFELDVEELKQKILKIITSSQYRDKLFKEQMKRKEELIFNWEDKIIEILED